MTPLNRESVSPQAGEQTQEFWPRNTRITTNGGHVSSKKIAIAQPQTVSACKKVYKKEFTVRSGVSDRGDTGHGNSVSISAGEGMPTMA